MKAVDRAFAATKPLADFGRREPEDVAKVQNLALLGWKHGQGLDQPPRGVQLAAADQAAQQVAAGAVDVHEPKARSGDLVLPGGVLLGVGDIQPAAELLDVEGRKPGWQLGVAEPTRQVDPVEVPVEDVAELVV